MKKILLTFDVEEFDLPREFNGEISDDEMHTISFEGTKEILRILEKFNVRGTFFLSAKFAKKYPKLIKEISKDNEIGLHCLEHSDDYRKMNEEYIINNLNEGKKYLEKLIGKKINGFRAPRFYPVNYKILKELGFSYDSSLNPCFIPGRYNNMFKKRRFHFNEGVKVIPASVYPVFRFPMIFLCFRFFKRFSLPYEKLGTLLNRDYVVTVLHPWDFISLKKFNIPFFIKRNSGNVMSNIFEGYISWCKNKKYEFIKMGGL